jgi:hypothetical protein
MPVKNLKTVVILEKDSPKQFCQHKSDITQPKDHRRIVGGSPEDETTQNWRSGYSLCLFILFRIHHKN